MSRAYRKNLSVDVVSKDVGEAENMQSNDSVKSMFEALDKEEQAKSKVYTEQFKNRQAQLDAMDKVKADLEAAQVEREAFRKRKKDAILRRTQDQATVLMQGIVR